MDRRFAVNNSAVVSEIIDGEAIMMHQTSGDYFSAAGVGALIWSWIGEGRSRAQMLDLLEASFAQDPKEIATAVDSFLSDLLTHRLVREVGEATDTAPAAVARSPIEAGEEFVPPVLNVYTDMRDVLMLDPIHEVEEEAGWPTPKLTGTET